MSGSDFTVCTITNTHTHVRLLYVSEGIYLPPNMDYIPSFCNINMLHLGCPTGSEQIQGQILSWFVLTTIPASLFWS